jgi:hypothetical protein
MRKNDRRMSSDTDISFEVCGNARALRQRTVGSLIGEALIYG